MPEITLMFWVVKLLTTAGGEATSDYLALGSHVVGAAVETGLLVIGLVWQFRVRRYTAAAYSFLAYAIAIFGTGVSDTLHLTVGLPYAATTLLWAVVLAGVFTVWYRSERTLSIHSIVTRRREMFYWTTVFATFALGTALGDFTATTLGLGYLSSVVLFFAAIVVPRPAPGCLGLNAIAAFWWAYVLTRPLGASVADYFSKPRTRSAASASATAAPRWSPRSPSPICVAYLAVTRRDIQPPRAGAGRRPGQQPAAPARRPSEALSAACSHSPAHDNCAGGCLRCRPH